LKTQLLLVMLSVLQERQRVCGICPESARSESMKVSVCPSDFATGTKSNAIGGTPLLIEVAEERARSQFGFILYRRRSYLLFACGVRVTQTRVSCWFDCICSFGGLYR